MNGSHPATRCRGHGAVIARFHVTVAEAARSCCGAGQTLRGPEVGMPRTPVAVAAAFAAPGARRQPAAAGIVVSGRVFFGRSSNPGRIGEWGMRVLTLLVVPRVALAADPLAAFGITSGRNGAGVSVPMQIVLVLTLMTLLPAAIMCVTPFLRITVVLHFLRQALGTQSAPSNQVLLGLSLFLTMVIIQPIAADMYRQGWQPLESGKATVDQAID